ncbi:hypothetical protein IWQ55_006634 [Labrenzia sp. EL_208]|nr:hypothetical protein [Labrenzia sp. EL_132]MBG6233392.1 hypothetical protein [Labrenzia sp. EL_208]
MASDIKSVEGTNLVFDTPHFLDDFDATLKAPELSKMSVGQMAALQDGFADIVAHMNGLLSQPRFSDRDGPNSAADFLETLTEFIWACGTQIHEELWKNVPTSSSDQETRAKKLIEFAIRDGESLAEIAARAAHLSAQQKNRSH